MKAVLSSAYGSPDVLQLKEVQKPSPAADQVLVRVRAASINTADLFDIRGGITRLLGHGLTKPKDPRVGIDVAGTVVELGSSVSKFKPGDAVFGACPGSLAEYACAAEDRVVLKPPNVSFEQAASCGVASMTALQGLRDRGKIQSGQRVAINGASGGVGTFSVQIAKAFGAQVTGICSTGNLELVSSIGADRVVDYKSQDFTRAKEKYDLIFDVASNRSITDCKRALKPGGLCLVVGFSSFPRLFEHLVIAPLRNLAGTRKVRFMGIAKFNEKDLLFVKDLLETGKLKPVIDRRYSLGDTAEAFRYLATKHARGKVVVTVALDA
jgi:NADPH:quinone reductase-like Zn-dependent oxidoreductase